MKIEIGQMRRAIKAIAGERAANLTDKDLSDQDAMNLFWQMLIRCTSICPESGVASEFPI